MTELVEFAGRDGNVLVADAAGDVGDAPGPGQLEQRERIAVAFGDDLVANRGVERAVHALQEQRPRIAVAERSDAARLSRLPWRWSTLRASTR